jgi:uncharacterized membrane protein (UPF0127 family)
VRIPQLIVTVAVVVVATACGTGSSPREGRNHLTIMTGGGEVHVRVEVADGDAERAEGLMGRTSLGARSGMAFVWEEPVETTFWMKDTLIPLSIAFWDERGRILAIYDMTPCEEDPCPSYGPDEPFVGALEVNRGFFDEHGVEVGDRIELTARA